MPINEQNRKILCWLPYFIIGLVVSLAYSPTFTGEFILDDKPLIQKNSYIREIHSFRSYFMQEDGVPHESDKETYHTGYYRPLINLSYWIDFKLWGMSAPGFRTTNLILHLVTCFLLFRVVDFLIGNRQAAFWTALLFALHPVNTESVSWVVCRNNILVTLFSLLSLYFYFKSSEGSGYLNLVASVLFFAMAVLSKEFGVMVFPILLLYQRLLSDRRQDVYREFTKYLPFILILICYFILRTTATSSWFLPSDAGDLWKRVYFAPYLITLNLGLIFLPYNLHSFIVQYPSAYISWRVFIGFGCCALCGLLLWRERKDNIVRFAFFSFFLALSPVLSILPLARAVTLISMRWLYFPMAFLLLALSIYIKKLSKINYFLTASFLGLVAIYLGVYSYVLNRGLWHDEGSFFTQEIIRFKNSYYAYGYAVNLLNKKEYREAERYFRIAIEHYPHQARNYINYSALLIQTGQPDHALLYLSKAKPLTMTHDEKGEWLNNMGMAYFHLSELDKAIDSLKDAVVLCPSESQYWTNLGGAYGSKGDYINSVSALKKGLRIAPESIQLRKNLAVTYIRMGKYPQAISVLEKIPPEKRGELSINELLDKARKRLKEIKNRSGAERRNRNLVDSIAPVGQRKPGIEDVLAFNRHFTEARFSCIDGNPC